MGLANVKDLLKRRARRDFRERSRLFELSHRYRALQMDRYKQYLAVNVLNEGRIVSLASCLQ